MEQRTLIVTVQPDWRGRDVRRVQEDVTALADLGLLERTDRGGVVCPLVTFMSTWTYVRWFDPHIASLRLWGPQQGRVKRRP